MPKEILFICTGNYYRSRFAEAVFNYHATERGLPWRAFSRGLAIHLVDGPISPFTLAALRQRKIGIEHTGPDRQPLREVDLQRAARTFALKREEHLSMMEAQFPAWSARITYWDVHDLDFAGPEQALPEIEGRVLGLLEGLSEE